MESKDSNSKTNERVEKIFKDLKDKGLVNDDHYLIPGDEFKAPVVNKWLLGIIPMPNWNGIKYDNERLEKELLSDVSLRWALLHEEAHLSEHKFHHYFAYVLFIGWIFLFLILLKYLWPYSLLMGCCNNIIFNLLISRLGSLIKGIIALLFSSFISLFILFISSKTLLKKTEFNCDRTAAKKIKDTYGVKNSSLLAQESYDWLKDTAEEREGLEGLEKWKQKCKELFSDYFDPHPSWCVRIEKLKKLDEDIWKN